MKNFRQLFFIQLRALQSVKFGTCTVVSVNGTLVEDKCVHSRVNMHNLASTSVPFTLTAVQVTN
jgi:hypothetical protein